MQRSILLVAVRRTPPPAAAPSRENIINLMDTLRRSIPAESPSPRPQRRAVAAKAASPKGRKPDTAAPKSFL